jgi:hypothetical protein
VFSRDWFDFSHPETEIRSIPKELGAFGAMRRKALRSV